MVKQNKRMFQSITRTWNPIIEYPGYYVSTEGMVFSSKRGSLQSLKPIMNKCGHLYVFLYRDGLMSKEWVHRLVLRAFTRDPFPNEECRHLNGNPADNRLENLTWGTRKENANDTILHGRSPVGERSGTHKLTERDVLEIRKKCGSKTLRRLGFEYEVSHTCIRRAMHGITWGCLK